MARLPRYILPGVPQHIILRGNNRSDIFAGQQDYQFFKECLQTAAQQHGCDIHAYVLMTNHVHLLLTPQQETSISKTLQSVGRRYVQYFNHSQQRTGTLWEGRYKATLIDSERYLLTCQRYIELNPVRASMVAHPRDYPWSSYRCHAEGKADELISEHELYKRLGRKQQERQQAYQALFAAHVGEAELKDIREATNKGWALGNEHFKQHVEFVSSRRAMPLAKGRRKRVTAESSFEEIFNVIK